MKYKNGLPHLLTLVLLSAPMSFAFGEPMPNPSITPSAPSYREGGSNTGSGTGSASGLGEVTAWCQGSVGILNVAKATALPATLYSDFSGALAIYKSGVVQAIQNAETVGLGQSLTLKALERTLAISEALSMALIDSEDRDRMLVNFYMEAYDFLIKVAEEIDIPVYIPYVRANRPFDIHRHERRFAEYGVIQLSWLLQKFTYEDRDQYYTNFDAKIYLTLAEFITSGVSQDLSESIFANAYACQVQDLHYLGQMLGKHNAGDRMVYQGRNKYAVNSSVSSIKRVIEKLRIGCSRSNY